MTVGIKELQRKLAKRGDRTLYLAAIVRLSTQKQGNVLHGSKEQQNHFIDNFIADLEKQLNCKIILKRVVEEVSGSEAALSRRTELLEILKMMEGGILEGIIFEKLDRISRDQEFNIHILKTAYKSDCAIIQVNKGFIDLRNRSDRMSLTFENAMAEEVWFDLQEKVQRKSRAARVNNGKDTQTVPMLGLDPHPTQVGFYVINPEEQKVVIEIYSLFVRTSSYTKVEEHCREKEYKTKPRISKESIDNEGNRVLPRLITAKPFTKKALYYFLKNKKLRSVGHFKDNWEQYPDKQDENRIVQHRYRHDPVVPPELSAQVDATLERLAKENLKYGKLVHFLSGIFFTTDGKRLSSYGGNNPKNGRYHYYKNGTLKYKIPKDEIEALIVRRIKHYLANSGTVHQLLETTLKKQKLSRAYD